MSRKLTLLLAAAAALSGCTTGLAMKAMNGIGMCPPDAVATANQNFAVLSEVAPGQSANQLSGLTPERHIAMTMKGGDQVDALLYRTGHPRCRNLPTDGEFTPVLVDAQGLIVGIGPAAFEQYRAAALNVQDETPKGPSEPVTVSGLMKALPF
jgi:hypothetical protein